MIAATRLRGGNANSARGAAEAVSAARTAGCAGTVIVRSDSAYYSAAFCGAVRRVGAPFSVTVNTAPKVAAAIAAIGEDAWTAIKYPRAIWDDSSAAGPQTLRSSKRPAPRSRRRKARPSPPG